MTAVNEKAQASSPRTVHYLIHISVYYHLNKLSTNDIATQPIVHSHTDSVPAIISLLHDAKT